MEHVVRKSLLYKSKVEYADYCINHVEGCAHGCRYPCYAMLLKKRCGVIKDYKEWLKPKLVSNAVSLLRNELARNKRKIQYVHLCFTTDPFMYRFPEVGNLTLQIIEELTSNRIKSVVLTKGIRPPVLACTELYGAENEYGITLVSLNDNFKRRFEPYTASFSERISALRYLHSKGLKTWVSIEPYPTPNIIEQDLTGILNEVAFVDKIVFGKMNYSTQASQYKEWEVFYEECTQKVIGYCRTSHIEFHIKRGTSIANDIESRKRQERSARKGTGPVIDGRLSLFG